MSVTEFSLIHRFFSDLGGGEAVELAVGDDCAILRLAAGERIATSVDTQVVGVHFPVQTSPGDVAFRSVSAAASDLAAMGARPLGMTVALTLPEAEERWLTAFRRGLADAVGMYTLPLVGGDTTRGPLSVSVQVLGALPADCALLRGGAQAGHALYVSGTLGDAAGALAMLQGSWQPGAIDAEFLLQRFNRPTARIKLGRELLGKASAAIDLSDGLLIDAGHLAKASSLRVHIDPQLLPISPALSSRGCRDTILRWALSGGDDYELCFCLGEDVASPVGCTRIGWLESGEGVDCGREIDFLPGYQHFQASEA
ncbi:MAG: thiamine-phosphate kinase [Halioglobus sp.]|nr:thiamine-phosphate kinase [Halioglobus sp.]